MNGIIIINKPKGCTSHDIVSKVKKMTKEKVGHTGTLDPLATGVLPLLIGRGTACSKYLINHDKTYIVTLKLGIKTDTGDAEGKILFEEIVDRNFFQKQFIEKTLKSFLGEQEQIPPIYSAIKINGKKLYEYARKGQSVEINSRKIIIYDIQLLNVNEREKEIQFEVSCSKGTYIRSLCEDIAKKMGSIGYMKELQRTKVGIFTIEQAISVEQINDDKIKQNIITIEELFKDSKQINLNKKRLELFLNGVKLNYDIQDGIYRIYNEQLFIGIGIVKDKLLKRDIVVF